MLDRSDTLPPVDGHEPHQGLRGQVDCHGTGTAAAATHLRMVQPIQDCQVLLARGMSWSARECLLDAGVRPIVTDIVGLNEAVQAYLEGTIVDHIETSTRSGASHPARQVSHRAGPNRTHVTCAPGLDLQP